MQRQAAWVPRPGLHRIRFHGVPAPDARLRAFDLTRGKVVWRARLPAGGQASPMSYSAAGRQFVVIAAGGLGGLETARGDHRVAFALRR